MIPFEPETIESARARRAAALEKIYYTYGPKGPATRVNVFDFEEGLRIIATRDSTSLGIRIHITGSAVDGTRLYEDISRGRMNIDTFVAKVKARWLGMGGSQLTYMGIHREAGVPYFVEITDPAP